MRLQNQLTRTRCVSPFARARSHAQGKPININLPPVEGWHTHVCSACASSPGAMDVSKTRTSLSTDHIDACARGANLAAFCRQTSRAIIATNVASTGRHVTATPKRWLAESLPLKRVHLPPSGYAGHAEVPLQNNDVAEYCNVIYFPSYGVRLSLEIESNGSTFVRVALAPH